MSENTLEINEENIEIALNKIKELGYSVRSKEDEETLYANFKKEKDDLTRTAYTNVDTALFEYTTEQKLPNEKSTDFLKRVMESKDSRFNNAISELSKEKERATSLEAEIASLKESGGADTEAVQKKIEEIIANKNVEIEGVQKELELERQRGQDTLKIISIDGIINGIRGSLNKDVPMIEDIIENKKAKLLSIPTDIKEDGTIVLKNNDGTPMTNTTNGNPITYNDLVVEMFKDIIIENKPQAGTGSNGSDGNTNSVVTPSFQDKAEMEKWLKSENYRVGSKEWLDIRKQILANQPDLK